MQTYPPDSVGLSKGNICNSDLESMHTANHWNPLAHLDKDLLMNIYISNMHFKTVEDYLHCIKKADIVAEIINTIRIIFPWYWKPFRVEIQFIFPSGWCSV